MPRFTRPQKLNVPGLPSVPDQKEALDLLGPFIWQAEHDDKRKQFDKLAFKLWKDRFPVSNLHQRAFRTWFKRRLTWARFAAYPKRHVKILNWEAKLSVHADRLRRKDAWTCAAWEGRVLTTHQYDVAITPDERRELLFLIKFTGQVSASWERVSEHAALRQRRLARFGEEEAEEYRLNSQM
ncbi:hypothetical protein BDN72DRAFT_898215 [Pluteus cervinus]|uniref:Uncharacterized protein n=1 Tax=Pluteus cervinus TaxID=181527 RepID=A0ACD3ARK9_9AGAR|nr:hypothetical protein BDN72DRAFT_898215 [Pluteus cervinus]